MNRTERQTEKTKLKKVRQIGKQTESQKGNKGQDKGKTYRKSSPLI